MRDDRPKTNLSMLFRRNLMPGESSLAGFGVGLALVLLITTVVSITWALRVEQRTAAAAQRNELDIVGQLLTARIEPLLTDGDVSGIRRLILNAAHEHDLTICRVKTADGLVLADRDPGAAEADRVPADNIAPLTDETDNITDDESLRGVHALLLNGQPVAELELMRPVPSFAQTSWQFPIGIGAVSVVTLITLLLLYRRVRHRMMTAMMVRDALIGLGQSDVNESAVELDAGLGEEAAVWNKLLGQIKALRLAAVERRTESLLTDRRESRTDLNAACDAMADGLVLLNDSMAITYINGAAAIFLEHDRDTLFGKTLSDVMDDQRVCDAARSVCDKGGSARGIIEVDRRENGSQGVLRFIARPVRQSDDATAMLIIQDVTQQRIAHESHSAFLAQAAHELRTPLTNIRLHVEEAIETGDTDPAFRSECLNVINSETARLTRIVGDMLSVAEIEAGALMLMEDDVQLQSILQQLEKDQLPSATEKQITLKFLLPPKLPPVHGDQDKLLLALHNLLGNAIKYTPEGGAVTVEVDTHNENLEIRVIDTGYGVSEDDAERIFNKFYRANDERVRKVTGSGLGLPLAREVVRLHGGDITFETKLNEGSTFTLTLPVREASATA